MKTFTVKLTETIIFYVTVIPALFWTERKSSLLPMSATGVLQEQVAPERDRPHRNMPAAQR